MAQKDLNSFIRTCVSLMVRPLADFCVSRGLKFQDFVEISKGAFIHSAERQLVREHRDVSTSKISIMTGVQRPEVNRLLDEDPTARTKDLVSRLVGQWVSDRRFVDGRRKPKVLDTQGARSEFARLVRAVSKDLNPHTVRFELVRLGLVEHKDGKAKLTQPAYVSTGDPEQTLRFASEDMSDLLKAVEENAFSAHVTPNLHARTQYDNIPEEHLPHIREWFLQLGARIHEECRTVLSKFDRDINPEAAKSGGRGRVVLGTFSHIHLLEKFEEDEDQVS